MAIICRPYNLLFIMTPRTACTAIGELLLNEFDGEYLPSEDIINDKGFILVQKKHSTLTDLIQNELLTKNESTSLLKFSAVRNPYDSLVSLYIKKKYKYQSLLSDPKSWVYRIPDYVDDMKFCMNHSFNTWIMKICYKKIIKRTLGFKPSIFNDYTTGSDIIMRYENINNDFKNILKKADINFNSSIPLVNPTIERVNNDYRPYYSNLSKMLVRYAFHNDFKSYNYTW